jgi:DNA-directed RNA polymerase specialized sigma24 family protein
MSHSTLPLFPTDDGWPYPDQPLAETMRGGNLIDDAEPDLDALELRCDPHAFDGLTTRERDAVRYRFGLDGKVPLSMKDLGDELGCSRSEARDVLGAAIDKLRTRLQA